MAGDEGWEKCQASKMPKERNLGNIFLTKRLGRGRGGMGWVVEEEGLGDFPNRAPELEG